jgi:hypothetical protein
VSRFIYHYAEYHYAECRYAECRDAECHYADCHHAECHYAECRYGECHYSECHSAPVLPVNIRLGYIDSARTSAVTNIFRASVTKRKINLYNIDTSQVINLQTKNIFFCCCFEQKKARARASVDTQ